MTADADHLAEIIRLAQTLSTILSSFEHSADMLGVVVDAIEELQIPSAEVEQGVKLFRAQLFLLETKIVTHHFDEPANSVPLMLRL